MSPLPAIPPAPGGASAASATISIEQSAGASETPAVQIKEPRPTSDRRLLRLSHHAVARAAQRDVVPDAVEYVMAHGRTLQRTGVTFFFLGRRDLPAADRGTAWAARLAGTVVLVGRDGEVITIYRNQRALPAIRRKQKYRLTREQCPAMCVLTETRCTA